MNSPLQAMRNLLDEDARFKLEAYQFIRESLQYAHEHLDLPDVAHATEGDVPVDQPKPKHVTGQELCQACRQYALEQYGYLSKMVLASWGIESTSDFGELVYNLIRIEQMRKSETDRREDFDDVYDFDAAFEPTFEFTPRNAD
ncbi:MAG: hypothetical protein HKN47_08395 [Pirellulaceae bacterium]|nr:hypothetical protein [Pirellulaceae bacterium]